MKVRFDPEANILYISIKDDKVKDMEDIDDDIWVEYNEKGEIIGDITTLRNPEVVHEIKEALEKRKV